MNKSDKKTIFFVIATVARVSFILRTDIFRVLRDASREIVIISPFAGDSDFRKEFAADNVRFEPLSAPGRFIEILNRFRNNLLSINHPVLANAKSIHDIVTFGYRPPETKTRRFKAAILRAITSALGLLGFGGAKAWDFVEKTIYYHAACRRLFQKYAPAVVVLASGGAEGSDAPFMLYALKFGVAAVATDSNIDVFEFRYFTKPRPLAKWMLFSETQKRNAMAIQGIKEENIAVTGAARYDYYFRYFKPAPRAEFLKSLGVDPEKKLITFGAKIPKLYPYNQEIFEVLLKTTRERLRGTAELFVRFDPGHDQNIYGPLLGEFKWEKAEQAPHRDHVANLLYHSDAVISVNSTFCIESCLIDVPSVWVGFGGGQIGGDYQAIYRLEMFKRMAKTGGIPVAHSEKELSDLVVKYVGDRSVDREKRRALVEQEYFKSDGRSGERVVAEILNLIK